MEFSEIGRRCEYSGCGIHDFLPFYCSSCKKYYCLEHREYSKHECPYNPQSNNTLNVKKQKKKRAIKYQCSYKDCKKCNQVPMNCQKCHKNFCLAHRYLEEHNCPYLKKGKKGNQ